MLAPPAVSFFVAGQPRTKGSLRPIHRKRGDGTCFVSLIEQGGFDLAHWRTLVATEAKRAMGQRLPLTGPLRVALTFVFARPAANKDMSPYAWGNKRWDVDKLARLALDAMTDAAAWTDDSQVAELGVRKLYICAEHPTMGAQVSIEALS